MQFQSEPRTVSALYNKPAHRAASAVCSEQYLKCRFALTCGFHTGFLATAGLIHGGASTNVLVLPVEAGHGHMVGHWGQGPPVHHLPDRDSELLADKLGFPCFG